MQAHGAVNELEALDNPTLFARRNELDRDALVASRLPTWADAWLDDKCDEFLADMPALASDDDVLFVLERIAANRLGECGGFVRHLCRRLVRRPNPAAASVLRKLLAGALASDAAHRTLGASVGCAALACDPGPSIPLLVAQLGTDRESVASVCAVFLEDPARAYDRVGDALVLEARGPAQQRRRRVLQVLVADGIPDAASAHRRSTNAQGFLAADDRWAAALLALKSDPTLVEAKRALANVAPDVLDALRPKKKSTKAIPTASLVTLGTVAYGGATPGPVNVRGDLLMVATSPTSLTLRRIEEGLPVLADFALPGARSFPTEAVGPYDSPFEAFGVLDAVLHPDGTSVALASHGEVLLVGFDGAIRAEVVLEDTIAHRLCFGARGDTLFVATNGDDGHAVTALDGRTLAHLGRTKNLGEFPDPAWFSAHPHPNDDVGVFAIQCGQDGSWVKVIELATRGPLPRKQKLHANAGWSSIYGYAGDVVVSGASSKLSLRSWPDLSISKSVKLEGECRGGAVAGEYVLLAIAEMGDTPDKLAVCSSSDGARVAEARWPAGEAFVDGAPGALVTSSPAGITVRRVEVPAGSKRAKS